MDCPTPKKGLQIVRLASAIKVHHIYCSASSVVYKELSMDPRDQPQNNLHTYLCSKLNNTEAKLTRVPPDCFVIVIYIVKPWAWLIVAVLLTFIFY